MPKGFPARPAPTVEAVSSPLQLTVARPTVRVHGSLGGPACGMEGGAVVTDFLKKPLYLSPREGPSATFLSEGIHLQITRLPVAREWARMMRSVGLNKGELLRPLHTDKQRHMLSTKYS